MHIDKLLSVCDATVSYSLPGKNIECNDQKIKNVYHISKIVAQITQRFSRCHMALTNNYEINWLHVSGLLYVKVWYDDLIIIVNTSHLCQITLLYGNSLNMFQEEFQSQF